MKRKYPKLGGYGRFKRKTGTSCKFCEQPTFAFIEVRVNYFRGDDERYHVCEDHLQMAKNDIERLMKEYYDDTK
jgi:hypothetical protein